MGQLFNFECAKAASGDSKEINVGAAVGTIPLETDD